MPVYFNKNEVVYSDKYQVACCKILMTDMTWNQFHQHSPFKALLIHRTDVLLPVVVAGERTALCKCNSAEEGAAVLFLRDLVLKRELKFHLASFSEAGFDFNAISDTDQ